MRGIIKKVTGEYLPGDDVEKVNFGHLHEVARFIYALILEMM